MAIEPLIAVIVGAVLVGGLVWGIRELRDILRVLESSAQARKERNRDILKLK